jgi:hypothetical protein
MRWPQVFMLLLFGLSLGRGIFKDGDPDTPISFRSNLQGVVIMALILWWGGFWGGGR